MGASNLLDLPPLSQSSTRLLSKPPALLISEDSRRLGPGTPHMCTEKG